MSRGFPECCLVVLRSFGRMFTDIPSHLRPGGGLRGLDTLLVGVGDHLPAYPPSRYRGEPGKKLTKNTNQSPVALAVSEDLRNSYIR